jgi:hypothetical protein
MSFSRAAMLFLGLTPAQTRANREGFRGWTCFHLRHNFSFMKILAPQSAEKYGVVSSQPGCPKSSRPALMSRYTDSYLVARTITTFGAIVKFIAFIIGGGVILVSLVVGGHSTQYLIGGFLLAAIVGIPIFVLGVLVTAQGQILKATLDTAVNSSPLLTKDEMKQIMSLD